MTAAWPQPPKIVVVTGPGLSREAGFAPFDAESMPPGLRVEDVVTREGFARDPARVQDFYNLRRRQLQGPSIRPNPAHDALAAYELMHPGEVLVATRNIDDLHERAGSLAVIHTHGELLKARCTICTKVSEWRGDILAVSRCPVCGNEGHLRPHIVWVGEPPLRMETIYEAVTQCRLFLVIGTSAANEPVAGMVAEARRFGARTVEFTRQPSTAASHIDESVSGRLCDSVPEFIRRQLGTA